MSWGRSTSLKHHEFGEDTFVPSGNVILRHSYSSPRHLFLTSLLTHLVNTIIILYKQSDFLTQGECTGTKRTFPWFWLKKRNLSDSGTISWRRHHLMSLEIKKKSSLLTQHPPAKYLMVTIWKSNGLRTPLKRPRKFSKISLNAGSMAVISRVKFFLAGKHQGNNYQMLLIYNNPNY